MKRPVRKSDLLECIYEVNPQSSNTTTIKEDLPISNRVLPDDQKSYDPKNLKVTASFQKHVAKHLDAYLDQVTCYKINKKNKIKKKRKKSRPSDCDSVLLLKDSKTFLSDKIIEFPRSKGVSRSKREDSVSYDLLLARAKEVAVTPEYILSREEVKNWAPEDRGKVEFLKQN